MIYGAKGSYRFPMGIYASKIFDCLLSNRTLSEKAYMGDKLKNFNSYDSKMILMKDRILHHTSLFLFRAHTVN